MGPRKKPHPSKFTRTVKWDSSDKDSWDGALTNRFYFIKNTGSISYASAWKAEAVNTLKLCNAAEDDLCRLSSFTFWPEDRNGKMDAAGKKKMNHINSLDE